MVTTMLLSSINGFAQIKNEHNNHLSGTANPVNEVAQNTSQLKAVFDNYFSIKDALISSDASTAATKATSMATAIKVVDMGKLSSGEHSVDQS